MSPVTVSQALGLLAAEGIVDIRPGAGTFVAVPSRPTQEPDYSWQTVTLAEGQVRAESVLETFSAGNDDSLISFAEGYLHPSLVPKRLLASALARAARRPDAFESPPVAGIKTLRSWFAQTAAPDVEPGHVLITSGGQGSITAIFRGLIPAGETLLLGSPTYHGALAVTAAAGIKSVPVPVDNDGVVPELLDIAFERTGARAFYCQPRFQNPTGTSLSAERRSQILEVAAAHRAFVIEDDYARWLGHGDPPAPTLLSEDTEGRVVHIASLSKPLAATMRIGAIIARGPVFDRLQTIRVVDDMMVNRPLQEATIDLVTRPDWARHVRVMANALTRRSHRLALALHEYLPEWRIEHRPRGGFYLWVRLPEGTDDLVLVERARANGVVVLAGRRFYPAEAPAPHIRISVSTADEAVLDTGVKRLAEAFHSL